MVLYTSKYQSLINYTEKLKCKGCDGSGIFKWYAVSGRSKEYDCTICLGSGANDMTGKLIVERPYTMNTVINALLYILDE